jgi:hypothetical protein
MEQLPGRRLADLRGRTSPVSSWKARSTRKEGLAYADSPTNLMWRLQNDFARQTAPEQQAESPSNEASFTEITLDVHHTASDKAPA